MTKEAKQEIRRALLGRTQLTQDGRLEVLEKGELRIPVGIADGAGAVRFFGIFKKARRLKAACPDKKARLLAAQAMREIGRELVLAQQPEAVACLVRYVLTRPAVLVFDYQEDVPVLTAWTGRGLTGLISVRRALKAFLKRMPKQLTLSDGLTPEEQQEALEKQRKKEQKQEKKKNKKKRREQAEPAPEGDTAKTTEEQTNESES
jgi:hypothetical protein